MVGLELKYFKIITKIRTVIGCFVEAGNLTPSESEES